MYCLYYQAIVKRSECWFFVATLKSFEHLCFDRTLDKERSLFEFYVPVDQKNNFLNLIDYMIKANIVTDLVELPNRLSQSNEEL